MNFATLKYDLVFREVFSHENILKQFISDVTGIPMENIKSVRLVSPYLRKQYRRQKQGILDIALVMNDDTKIDIELQIRSQQFWMKRQLFYLAKMYTDDMKIGERYDRLHRCIAISILDFKLIEGDTYHSVYTLKDKDGKELTELFEIHIIELTKKLKENDALSEWIRLFNARDEGELDMIKTMNPGILEAVEMVKTMNLSKRLRMRYEAHLKAVRDRWAEDEYVREQGKLEGIAVGRSEGIAAGNERINRINRLNAELAKQGRTDDIVRAASDVDFQDKLFKEFGL